MEFSNTKSFRRKTREVNVGSVGIGGKNPIRIQSMTTSLTSDVESTVAQIMKLADYGCEIARVTVQGKKEAAACEKIKSSLLSKGYNIPVVADIHFYPPAAMEVVEFVDKIRINPGNFLDKRASFKTLHYDSLEEYNLELARIEEGFAPLVLKCIQYKKAIRIGVNHGSLSDRIMSRYGDNPKGMVQSALEYARVAIKYGFNDMIFSMKSSNPLIMVEAYRHLAVCMEDLKWDFPFHLGVTEAGLGEDGRIKSAVGIGTLLLDGIGDTIRVSLTEDPWDEIAPAKQMVRYFEDYKTAHRSKRPILVGYKKDEVSKDTILMASVSNQDLINPSFFEDFGLEFKDGAYVKGLKTPHAVLCESNLEEKSVEKLQKLVALGIPYYFSHNSKIKIIDHLPCTAQTQQDLLEKQYEFIIASFEKANFFNIRDLQAFLQKSNITTPLILSYRYPFQVEQALIFAAMDIGSSLVDQVGQGVMLTCQDNFSKVSSLMLNVLQACRKRLFKTDYIACPGCGRTLFNLQDVTQTIKAKTAHLPGVKIAIMGCIVNGPGEMADADFGYVGSRSDSVDLYIGKNCIEKNIPSHLASDKLINLIKSSGKWVDPPS
jgi:(E)-4-hydroxy-3-methylbut-2-enyl-diphosphate synthase